MKRDYYEVLGISRDADTQQLKKAYRKMAREYHPDVNNHDPESEERFKEATEAYEVLSDPERRQTYDAHGHEGLRSGAGAGAGAGFGGGFADFNDIFEAFFGDSPFGGDMFTGARGGRWRAARGEDVMVEVELDLEEAAFGTTKEITVELVDTCPACGGVGATDPSDVETCSECGGAGRVQTVRRTPFGQFVQAGPCAACAGRGETITDPCPECRGAGRAPREKTLSVEIPAGVDDGQRVRLTGQGAAGERGAPAGDAYVNIRVKPHTDFERHGNDILYRLDMTMVDAALGTTVTVPTLDGEEDLTIEPGTQPGEVKVLRGRGVPRLQRVGRGDQHVLVNVLVPRNLNEHQRELLEELDECCGMEHYNQKSDGLFQRLRQLFAG